MHKIASICHIVPHTKTWQANAWIQGSQGLVWFYESWASPQNALNKHDGLGYGSTHAWHCFGSHKNYYWCCLIHVIYLWRGYYHWKLKRLLVHVMRCIICCNYQCSFPFNMWWSDHVPITSPKYICKFGCTKDVFQNIWLAKS